MLWLMGFRCISHVPKNYGEIPGAAKPDETYIIESLKSIYDVDSIKEALFE